MELVLQREFLTSDATLGCLSSGGAKLCYTLEDIVRDPGDPKIYGRTSIPAGLYRVEISMSQRFKKPLPILLNVPGFTGVRIHAGNTSADTEGCILVGLTKGKDFVGKSQMAMSLLQPRIQDALDRGEEVWIEIRNPGAAAGAQPPHA